MAITIKKVTSRKELKTFIRFNYELYDALKNKINDNDGSLKHNLPGIEFDVELEIGKPKCHIIAIFDDSDNDKVSKIEEKMFAIKKISKPNEYYSLEEFEKVLRKGLTWAGICGIL